MNSTYKYSDDDKVYIECCHIDDSSFNRWGDSLQAGAEVVSNLPVSKDQ